MRTDGVLDILVQLHAGGDQVEGCRPAKADIAHPFNDEIGGPHGTAAHAAAHVVRQGALLLEGLAGVLVNGWFSLWFGSLIVAFHNVWEGLPTLLTVLGWAQVLKGLVSLVLPQVALRSLARVSPDRAWEFVAGGIVFLFLSAALWYSVLTR